MAKDIGMAKKDIGMTKDIGMAKETCDQVFEKISKNDIEGLRTLLADLRDKPDFHDEHGMSPLQHAAYKGNKQICQMLIDQGADVNAGKYDQGYTALHFAALSGNSELCAILLAAGAKSHATNSIGRTASQMAAFVGNHDCVAVINNFMPKSEVEYLTVPHGLETEPQLPPLLATPLHNLIMQVNVHPIRVALNLHKVLLDNLDVTKKALHTLCEKEMKKGQGSSEVLAFKLHYLACVVGEVAKHRQADKQNDVVTAFAKTCLNPSRGEEYVEQFIRDCVREFPFRDCTIFKQMLTTLAKRDTSPPGVVVISNAINGQRGFNDGSSQCVTCGQEKVIRKCSKCRAVQYCDRECQRLHWFVHKKECNRETTNSNQNGVK